MQHSSWARLLVGPGGTGKELEGKQVMIGAGSREIFAPLAARRLPSETKRAFWDLAFAPLN